MNVAVCLETVFFCVCVSRVFEVRGFKWKKKPMLEK